MIDLTPLDVRKKKGDFRRCLRGYDPPDVDGFLELVAERLEELVRENLTLRERVSALEEAAAFYRERERAMNDALVSAQQLREEMRDQAARDAELVLREAKLDAERIAGEAQAQLRDASDAVRRVQAQRAWFLRAFRAFVERQLNEIEQEEERLRTSAAAADAAEPDAERPPWLSALESEPIEGG